jgi:acetyl-CoA carboxylase biotin carboxyl carrier protein
MADESEIDANPTTDLVGLAEFIERLVAVAQKGGVSALEVKTDDLRVKLRSGKVVEVVAASSIAPIAIAESGFMAASQDEPVGYTITSPMVGTFYHATSPSDPPLVRVGDRVETGQLIGIIEAMKIMNEITSDRSGTVIEVVAANATAVEYGSPLIRLGP